MVMNIHIYGTFEKESQWRGASDRSGHIYVIHTHIYMYTYIDSLSYYLRSKKDYQSVVYPPRLAVDLGSYVDGEAHGWARQPYGYFDPAPRPRDIIHTYIYGRRPRLAHPVRG